MHPLYPADEHGWGVILIQNAFRVGLLATALMSSAVAGAGMGLAAPDSGSAMFAQPQPPTITLMPHGMIHVDAPADGTGWSCQGISAAPPAYKTARVMRNYVPTGSAMMDFEMAGATPTADLQFPPNTMVWWDCSNDSESNTKYESVGPVHTLP